MSIEKAIERAYKKALSYSIPKVYWAIDLHGVCLKSSYETGKHEFINQDAIEALQLISWKSESIIILWSSCHQEDWDEILKLFKSENILVDFFNENPFVGNNEISNFDKKFYFSVLLDDKAGFDPATDWKKIINLYKNGGIQQLSRDSKIICKEESK